MQHHNLNVGINEVNFREAVEEVFPQPNHHGNFQCRTIYLRTDFARLCSWTPVLTSPFFLFC